MTKVTVIGDTHGCHRQLKLQPGNILIHTGDVTAYGLETEVLDFIDWFEKQPFEHKVFIAGNHDLWIESNCSLIMQILPKTVFYLQNDSICIDGLNIFGSPASPDFFGMAFNYNRASELDEVWSNVPEHTDILITHTPPKGYLDNGRGCAHLSNRVLHLQPAYHLFGHIHEAYGVYRAENTTYVNAALCNLPDFVAITEYEIVNQEWTFNL